MGREIRRVPRHKCPVCGQLFFHVGRATAYPDTVFVGWIDAKPWQKRRLRRLGVFGPMPWSHGTFQHCYATKETLEKLIQEWKLPNPGSFTAVDNNGTSLPEDEQHWWYLRWKGIQAEL